MNLWEKYIDELLIVAPLDLKATPTEIDLAYTSEKIRFIEVVPFSFIRKKEMVKTLFKIPIIIFKIFMAMRSADHIHLRCPGNMGLLGAVVQILFPRKKKTAKYAGNWDWHSRQPFSYRLQQRILRNTVLTKNIQVLVYGDWKESKNIKPFFTATYFEREIKDSPPRILEMDRTVKLLFVGSLDQGKRPGLSLEVSLSLHQNGIKNEIHIYGNGIQKIELEKFILENQMNEYAFIYGSVNADVIKHAYQNSHFLLFLSKSEGWPKVVAESMFWGCLPITTAVSCVPQMVGNGSRGDLVEPKVETIISRIEYYLSNSNEYHDKCQNGIQWSRQFTMERFEEEIKKILS
jgi:glycosyltransferase involved in cell wall biosynthesis